MKTEILSLKGLLRKTAIAGVITAYVLTASTVFAAVTPSVDTTIKNGSNAVVTTAPVGTNVRSSVTVSSSTGPTALGTVDFNLYTNTTCVGTPTTQAGVLLASGSADSSSTTLGSSGLSYRVFYNGQNDVYASTTGPCVSLSPISSLVTLTSGLSSTSVLQGTSVSQSVTINNATSNASGTVAYGVYTNSSCTADRVDAGTKTVTNASVSQSNSIQFNNIGTYYFQAVYSGDQFNNSATSSCQTLSVLSNSTTTPTPTPGPGSISGNVYNDLNKNRMKEGGENGIGGVTIKLYDRSVWWNWALRWSNNAPTKTTTTDSNGNYSFSSLPDGIYGVEEIIPSGWSQISSDFRWVLILNGKSFSGLDFANVSKTGSSNATSTEQHKKEKKEKKEEKKEEQKQKKINKLQLRIEKIKSNQKED